MKGTTMAYCTCIALNMYVVISCGYTAYRWE